MLHDSLYPRPWSYPPRSTIDSAELYDGRHRPDLVITNVRLAHTDRASADKLWKVECRGGRVYEATPLSRTEQATSAQTYEIDAKGSLMIPSLCHSHIHLDKCFILDRCGDLATGNFEEAMRFTARAKSNFSVDDQDLYDRAYRLIHESVQCGVTSMRAHVEVDTIVRFSCLNMGLRLQAEWRGICEVQIAVFAQERIFDLREDTEPGENWDLLQEAATRRGVTVVGSAPYVEATVEQSKHNIRLILELANLHHHHADFHLDYNLDPETEPLVYEVISQMRKNIGYWKAAEGLRVTIGHATRLQLFTPAQWRELADAIVDLPISFVGLPQSDMYMMGRAGQANPLGPPRSTLRVPYLANNYGFQIAMGVNNVQNAFTPQGSLDPLSLCTFAVAVFQAATPTDIRTLARSVTLTSKLAIGQQKIHTSLFPTRGDPADFVILHGNQSLQSAVLNPSYDRTTINAGGIVSRRLTSTWTMRLNPEFKTVYVPWYKRMKWFHLMFLPYFFYKWAKSELFETDNQPLHVANAVYLRNHHLDKPQ